MVLNELFDLASERQFLAAIIEASVGDVAGARKAIDGCGVLPEHLHLPAHREVYETARALLAKGQPVNMLTLWTELSASKVCKEAGGVKWLGRLEEMFGTAAALPSLSERIIGLALRRTLFDAANRLRTDACSDATDPAEVLREAAKRLASMTTGKVRTLKTLTDVLGDCVEQMEQAQLGKAAKRVSTGMRHLDAILGGGLPPSVLTLIGAEPGTGKSAVLASILSAAAKTGAKIGIFSLEDEAHWIGWRLWAFESDLPQPVLKAKRLTEMQQQRAVDGIDRLAKIGDSVFIDDRCGLTASEICATATDMVVNHGVQAILIDHLGEVKHSTKAERFDLAVGDSLREIRDIAKRFDIPVVVASQLSRRKDRKPGEIPTMADFRNSGDIEAVARVMLGLGRVPGSDCMEIGVLKNTNGTPGVKIKFEFQGMAAMVRECEEQDDEGLAKAMRDMGEIGGGR